MDVQGSGNRGISRRESIEKGSVPETTATDFRGIEISRDDSDRFEQQYFMSMKLCLIVFSLTLACFLMTLSSKVLATHTFLCFLVTFELGALICGLSKNPDMLIVGRTTQGCGGSGILNRALTILAAPAPISKRPIPLGIIMSTASIGQVIGPLMIIGGALTRHASWRVSFYLNLPAGFLTALVIFFIHIPSIRNSVRTSWSSKKKSLNLDPCGFILFTYIPTIISFLLALEWGDSSYSWSSATIIDYQRSLAHGKRGENATDFLGDYWVFDFSGESGSGCMSLLNVNTGAGEWIGFQILVGAGRGMVSQGTGYNVPNIDTEAVVASGATELRDLYLAAGGSSAAFLCSFGLGWGMVKKKNEKQEGDQEGLENPAKSKNLESTVMEVKA
ncbi:hypothetical protein BOTCAL_0527g00060 [Botryotinia calthae]|uniref:Major facilitator superfamily (MFS) profile domain-containing protein n=1 Tax=Botryotinia calthae TaxID=38488 RepID=A0A4Y8CND8_9HELO|nr:hypothetical protein BOTCAL_0527g00060 [Botryotinia calthae]